MGYVGAISVPSAQIHVSNFCNLRCKHCYSSSSPDKNDILSLEEIENCLIFLKREGYRYVSFSGGEPLLYAHFYEALALCRKFELTVGVVSNGFAITPAVAQKLAKYTGNVAISLDGPREVHNEIRRSRYAYDKALSGISNLVDAGVAVSVVHTLTRNTLKYIDTLFELCDELGVSNVQMHPLEEVGAARISLPGEEAGREICSLATVALLALSPSTPYQIDAFNRELVSDDISLLGIVDKGYNASSDLSTLVNPVILDQHGSLMPIQYGLSDKFKIGNIRHPSFESQLVDYKHNGFKELQIALRELLPIALDATKLPFFNWYGIVVKELAKKTAGY